MDKVLGYLGLARRGGLLETGEESVGIAVRAGKAKLLLLASDASENAQARAEGFVRGRKTLLLKSPCKKEEISHAVGKTGCSMVAITDLGLATSIVGALAALEPETYDEVAAVLKQRYEKAVQRKRESAAHERNKKIGKRRRANG
jgi:ribosomal protein L7Ae-like RNA K-turn-binding protein